MKTLKYRYWDEELKSFVYSDDFDYSNPLDRLTSFFQKAAIYSTINNIQECVGAVDKNSKDIYIGDIMSFPYRDEGQAVGLVENDDMYIGYSVQECDKFFGSMQLTRYNTKECEVVGNVFQNKDLL
jgi:uncharacterized phage protein (TIGR01671 family)